MFSHPGLTCVMISCAQRDAARRRTVPQLIEHDIWPIIFLSPCDPASHQANAEVGRRALRYADTMGKNVLFLEDDIDVAADFSTFLQMAEKEDEVTYFYVHDHPGRVPRLYGKDVWNEIREGIPQKRRLQTAKGYFGLYGSQAVYIPHRYIGLVLEVIDEGEGATDNCMLKAWARNGVLIKMALPHPIQHRNDRTARDNSKKAPYPKHSFSFALPRKP